MPEMCEQEVLNLGEVDIRKKSKKNSKIDDNHFKTNVLTYRSIWGFEHFCSQTVDYSPNYVACHSAGVGMISRVWYYKCM